MALTQDMILEEAKHRNECFRSASQNAVDCGIKALNALFLLNGAATTALLAQRDNVALQMTAIIFAVGALLAILGLGMAHIINLILGETWRLPHPENNDAPWIPLLPLKKRLSFNELTKLRVWHLLFCCLPGVVFLIGLISAGLSLR